MRKIKIAGALIFLAMSLSSCTAVALGAGEVAGGYTCAKTTLCDNFKKQNLYFKFKLFQEGVSQDVSENSKSMLFLIFF